MKLKLLKVVCPHNFLLQHLDWQLDHICPNAQLVQVVGPTLHHGPACRQVRRSVVGASVGVFDVRIDTQRQGFALVVSLLKARQRRDKAREQLADGIDPGSAKQEAKQAQAAVLANTNVSVSAMFTPWLPKYSICFPVLARYGKKYCKRAANTP